MSSDELPPIPVSLTDAIGFIRIRGPISWDQWMEWKVEAPHLRELFLEAARQVEADRATAIGLAANNVYGAAQVFQAVDGGEMLTALMLADKAREIAERLQQ